MTRVAIFGDSIAWGSWDPEVGGWVTRLKLDYMRRQAPGDEPDNYVSVHPYAVPGHRVADVRSRIEADLALLQPDAVVVAVGINDSPGDSAQVTPEAVFRRDYDAVLEAALRSTAQVLALTPTDVNPEVRPDQHRRLTGHRRLITDLCAKREVPVLDLAGLFTASDLCRDGLHPTSAGHEKIYRRVAAFLDSRGIG